MLLRESSNVLRRANARGREVAGTSTFSQEVTPACNGGLLCATGKGVLDEICVDSQLLPLCEELNKFVELKKKIHICGIMKIQRCVEKKG